ncbi:MAG: hypothetical protein ACRDKG_15505 [Actinomycetota bacterium]
MKRSAVVRFLPRSHRARFGAEIDGLLATSNRPVADVLNVAKQSAYWHVEALMRNAWTTSAVVLAAASIFALGYTINGLADGITELPKHWWSSAPVLGLALAGGLALIGRNGAGKSSRP